MASGQYRDLTVAGGPVRVHLAGTETTRPPVVLLHGAMLDLALLSWHHLLPDLAGDRRVVAVDLPRHGGSRPWSGRLDHARMVDVVTDVLDQLDLGRVDVVGLSMGGGLALGLALAHPERVRRLVLAAPGGLDERRPWQLLTWLYLRSRLLQRMTTVGLAASPTTLRRSFARGLAAGEDTADFADLLDLVRQEATARRAHREPAMDDWQITAYGPRRMRLCLLPQLPRLTAPSLWLRGADDPLVSEESIARAVALAPDATAVTVDGAGHLLPLDRPIRFAELTRAFLDESKTG